MFCGNCGTKLKDGKCPKCDKKVEKKTEKVKAEKVVTKKTEVVNEKANFAWAVLGFCVPVVGLILFLVFKNSRKDLSKKAGIGALIGFIKNVIVIILCYVFTFLSVYNVVNYIGHNYPENPLDYPDPWGDIYNDDDDDDAEDYIDTIEISNINTEKENLVGQDFFPRQFDEFVNKEYKFEKGITVIRNNDQVAIKDTYENKVLFNYNNVKKAYYHEFDCSGIDTILIVTNDKAYYINVNEHVLSNIKAVEITGKYNGYFYTYNQSFTCGGSIIALGKTSDGKYYDLNGEAILDMDNLYYYDDPNNWISTNRESKLAGGSGSVKAVVIGSVSSSMQGFIDSYGYAYSYVYDYSSRENNVKIEKINNSPAKKIEYNYGKDTVTIIFENDETYTFEYASLNY
ncbi:MAG: zinc ribbon domain-containing protein [Bacilli bacterium]|nr:zinc ribbon domain-containing protein [Bacilli bacterium]